VWTNSATNTYELCRAECLSRGNIYMSLQWGGECFCADAYATADAYYQVDDSNCNVVREPCSPNSHNCGGTWHQAIYQIGEVDWTVAVSLAGDGTTVTTDIGQTQFNELFNACPVVKYIRNGGVHSVYVRRSGRAEVDAFSLFTYRWASSNNVLGTDFDIYSSDANAWTRTGAWTFCNYDDPDVGYPRDCGAAGHVANQWFTMPSVGQHDASSGGGAQRFDIRNINSGASFEIYTGSDCPVATYNYGQAGGGNTCPAGTDVSEADCLAAAQSLLASGQTQGRTNLVAGSWGWVPPGCSVQTHFTHNQNGDFAAHYNRGNGNNDGGYTKVCNMECQHLENMDVVAGTFGHYGLDYTNSPSADECSATCTADAQCTAWVWRPSTGNCWISNQAVVNFEADTDRTTGLRCN